MKVRMFTKVLLTSGRTAYIVEIFDNGKAFLADIDLDDGEVDTDLIYPKDIKKILDY